jgi:ribosomal protein L37AE/L43A
MTEKYEIMKCPYCKINLMRTDNLTFTDWVCNKCKRCFKGGTMVKVKSKTNRRLPR